MICSGCRRANWCIPTSATEVEQRTEAAVNGQRATTTERRMRRLDGTEVEVESRVIPFLFEGKNAVQVILRDITARRAAERELRAAEAKYRSIFDNALEGIFQNTPEGVFISANPALARMLGFESPEELIRERNDLAQQSYADPAQRAEFQRLLEEKGVVNNFEYQVRRKDQSKIWVSENVRAVRDAARQNALLRGQRAGHHGAQTFRGRTAPQRAALPFFHQGHRADRLADEP